MVRSINKRSPLGLYLLALGLALYAASTPIVDRFEDDSEGESSETRRAKRDVNTEDGLSAGAIGAIVMAGLVGVVILVIVLVLIFNRKGDSGGLEYRTRSPMPFGY